MRRRRTSHTRLRRLALWLALAGLLGLLVPVAWLLSHLRPRHEYFETRRGTLEQVEVVPAESSQPGFSSLLVHARADTGLAVTFNVLRPTNAPGRLPLAVLLGGVRTGREAVAVVGDPGPIAVVALDYPYHGPERFEGVTDILAHLDDIQQALLDTPPAIMLTLDWLLQQPWVDPQRVELIGVSLGTPFAAVAGALDRRFCRVWLLHGGADNREWLAEALAAEIPSDLLRAPTATLLHLVAHGASFDTESWIKRISPRPVVIVGAEEDESLSRENVRRLFTAAREPKELHWTPGGHVLPSRPWIVRDLLAIVRARILGEEMSAAP